MSYERDMRRGGNGNGTSGRDTTSGLAPGKRTLTEGLLPAHPGARAAERGAPARHVHQAGRDLDAWPGDGAGAQPEATPVSAVITNPSGDPDLAVTMTGSVAETERARDDAYTPALVAGLEANPGLSLTEVLRHLAGKPLGAGADNARGLQHPTIVEYGKVAPPAGDGAAQKKRAVLIGNQHYRRLGTLGTPIAEAAAMQGQLASRGFEANVHVDQTAPEMTTLWGSMVDTANQGDELVAFYGGHGVPAGLVGIDHTEPAPADLFTNSQVSGVVNAATARGAHIRFVMDSCYAGAAVQAVREVRENELAAVTRSSGDQLRAAAMTGLRQLKASLLALLAKRTEILYGPDRAAGSRAAGAQPGGAARDVRPMDVDALPSAFERAVNELWAELRPRLLTVKQVVGHGEAPPPITDYETLGAQLNYLDDLWSAVARGADRPAAEPGASKPEPR